MVLTPESYQMDCTCGKAHKVLLDAAVIERDALLGLDALRAEHGLGGAAAAVYDENTYEATAGRHPAAAQEVVLPAAGLHADEHGVAALESRLGECEVLIAVGAGTIHDITRYVAAKQGVPFISAPTAASVDGFVSTVAAMTWEGFKVTMPAVSPRLLVADLAVAAKAPVRLTRAGVGDVLGKYVSLADWRMANLLTGEYYCDGIASLTRAALDDVVEGADALAGADEAAVGSLMKALVLSGVAMQLAGNSRPASAAEHHISHMIEMGVDWIGPNDALHGEKVGVGTLMCARRYRELAALGAADLAACHPAEKLAAYAPPDAGTLEPVFGRLTGGVQKENEGDCLLDVPPAALEEKWEAVCGVCDSIPALDTLEALYARLGVKRTLADIGVDEGCHHRLMLWSPYVRNRLTLMRVAHTVFQ